MRWFKSSDVPTEILEAYLQRKRDSTHISSCNTDKTNVYACDMKVKTRGIQLALTNCGIIVAYRELYGSESTTQVALVYLDLCDNFLSKQALNQYF